MEQKRQTGSSETSVKEKRVTRQTTSQQKQKGDREKQPQHDRVVVNLLANEEEEDEKDEVESKHNSGRTYTGVSKRHNLHVKGKPKAPPLVQVFQGDTVEYQQYETSGQCKRCVDLHREWNSCHPQSILSREVVEKVLVWMKALYVEQMATIGTTDGFFPKAPSTPLPKFPKLIIHDQVWNYDTLEGRQQLTKACASAFSSNIEEAHLWTCIGGKGEIALIRAKRVGYKWYHCDIRGPHDQVSFLENVNQSVGSRGVSARITTHLTNVEDWQQGYAGIPYMIATAEEMIRLTTLKTNFDMKPILRVRIIHSFTVQCEHEQRHLRAAENPATFARDEECTDVIQPYTNMFGLGQTYLDECVTIKPKDAEDEKQWMVCKSGEESADGQKWWYSEQHDKKYFTEFAALIKMDGNWLESLWRCQKNHHDYQQQGRLLQAKIKDPAKMPHASKEAAPYASRDIVDMLNKHSKGVDHDWTVRPERPHLYDEKTFDELFQKTGIGVMQFAKGEELENMRKEALDRASNWSKIAIFNSTEVIQKKKVRAKGKVEERTSWDTVASDLARLQVPLPRGQKMPGKDFAEQYFPKTTATKGADINARLTHENLLLQHRAAAAQNAHWDFPPRSTTDTKRIPGSVLVALWTTRLIIFPMSHRWCLLEERENEEQEREDDDSLIRQFSPVIIEIPEGSILFFSAIMHAGYGIWSLDEGLFRPAPSLDDMMQVRIRDLHIRYQAHAARPKQLTSNEMQKTIDPTKTVTHESRPYDASHFYFDHRTALPLVFPPVFTVSKEWLREPLKYDTSEFLDRADMPEVVQAEKARPSGRDTVTTYKQPSRKAKRSARAGSEVKNAAGPVEDARAKPLTPARVQTLTPVKPHVPTTPREVGPAPTRTSITTPTPLQKPLTIGSGKRPSDDTKDDGNITEQGYKRVRLMQSSQILSFQSRTQLPLEADLMDSEEVPSEWDQPQVDMEEFLQLCPCLPEWFDALSQASAWPDASTWKTRLAFMFSNQVRKKGQDILLANRLQSTIDVMDMPMKVPSSTAWALGLSRSAFLKEKDFNKLMQIRLKEEQRLNIACILTYFGGFSQIIVVKTNNTVRVWQDEEHLPMAKVIQQWATGQCAGIQQQQFALCHSIVVAAWLENPNECGDIET
jgi:hypothetical protein